MERGRVIELHELGLSLRTTATRVGHNVNTIQRCVTTGIQEGLCARRRRSGALKKRQSVQTSVFASSLFETLSSHDIRSPLPPGGSVFTQTIRNRMHEVQLHAWFQPIRSRIHEVLLRAWFQPIRNRMHEVLLRAWFQTIRSRMHEVLLRAWFQTIRNRMHEVQLRAWSQTVRNRMHEVLLRAWFQTIRSRIHEVQLRAWFLPIRNRIHEVQLRAWFQPIRNRIHEIQLCASLPITWVPLTTQHRTRHLVWCYRHCTRTIELHSVLCMDESRFCL
ncbi:hypothetical protein TNCV_855151 [Trichonephila clavipes]|nr:hypothetical protein TNCV_855151 [Trichonephila clavipes]